MIKDNEVELNNMQKFAYEYSEKLLTSVKSNKKLNELASEFYFDSQDIDFITRLYMNVFLAQQTIDKIKEEGINSLETNMRYYIKALNTLDKEDVVSSFQYIMDNLPLEFPALRVNRIEVLNSDTRNLFIKIATEESELVKNLGMKTVQLEIESVVSGKLDSYVVKNNVEKTINKYKPKF